MEEVTRALRLATHPDAGLRGHRPLRAHVRRGVRHRAQGDVHVQGPQRPLADAASRGHRADLPRVHRARHASRAAAGEGLHDRADVPLRRAAARAATASTTQLSVEAIGSADPAIDAEIIQLYHELLRRLGVTQWELHLNSIGDANCRPAYVEQLNAWLDAHADVLDEDARHKRATSPLRVFDVKNPRAARGARGRAEDRRVALRRVPRALRAGAAPPRRARRAVLARPDARSRARLLHAHDLRVHRRRTRTRTRRSAAAGATTGSSRRSAGRRRPGSASAPASSGCCSRSSTRASDRRAAARSTSSSSSSDGAPRDARAAGARRAPRARASPPTPTTPAARSRGR